MKTARRNFLKKGSALAMLSLTGLGATKGNLFNLTPLDQKPDNDKFSTPGEKPRMKIALQASTEPSEDHLKLIKQMGLDEVVLWTDASKASYEYYNSRRQIYADAGIHVFGFGNRDVHNQDTIVLNLPERDAKIEEYKTHIRNLGKAGIGYTTYAHMANGIWSTEREETRGGASARAFNLEEATTGRWAGQEYSMPLSHGREYTDEEIWENFEYFIKQVAPVAEESNVRIGIHPDDPPVSSLAGVPRCIFSNFDGYKRALEIADSPNIGICLCVGCWLEGGALMGKDVFETIQYFGERKKLFKIHFRNVNQPLPYFVETFLDNGYANMYGIMKALADVDFDGVIIADHIPRMVNGCQTAFTIGYMSQMLERVYA
jgi:mannonate dehydratase